MARAALVVLAAGLFLSCHPFATIRNLCLAVGDSSVEKMCNDAVTIDDGYGRVCVYSKGQASNPGSDDDPPRCNPVAPVCPR
jgi:hypothetical protein